MYTRVSAVFVLLTVSAHAGILDDVSGVTADVGNFFSSQYQNAKDLFSKDQSELEKNVERVRELLTGVKEQAKKLEPLASDAQKETLKSVDGFLEKVVSFQKEVKEEGAAKFDENKGEWQKMVTDIFDKGGLGSVLKLLGVQHPSAGSESSRLAAALFAPLFYAIFVR